MDRLELARLAGAAANALASLSAYRNVETVVGVCDCVADCKNVRVVIWRKPLEGDSEDFSREPYAVAYGVGPDAWTAIVHAHVSFEKVLDDYVVRQEEIQQLEELFELESEGEK